MPFIFLKTKLQIIENPEEHFKSIVHQIITLQSVISWSFPKITPLNELVILAQKILDDKGLQVKGILRLGKKHITHLWKELQMILNDFRQAKPVFKMRELKNKNNTLPFQTEELWMGYGPLGIADPAR